MFVSGGNQQRVAIVGPGLVGATAAYALLLSGVGSEIVLVGRDRARAQAHADDLLHAAPLSRATRVWAGDYAECRSAAVTVIAVGVTQRAHMTDRLDDLRQSAAMFQEIIPRIAEQNPQGILVIASNPVDVLTYAALKWSGFPAGRVIGSGTLLDTSRFRTLLAEHYGVASENMHAYIVGEHGESQVALLSSASLAGTRLHEYCQSQGLSYDPAVFGELAGRARVAGLSIVRGKGGTSFGIGAALVRIVRAIFRNEQAVLTVSTLAPPHSGLGEVCLSLPAVVGEQGITRVLVPAMSPSESEALRRSADVLKQQIALLPASPSSHAIRASG